MTQLGKLTCAVLAGVGCLAGSVTPAIAHENLQPPRAEYAPTMLVLDASGSMAGADPAGGTKMDAAKRATRLLIDAAPDGAPVGLTVYGTKTGSTPGEKEAGCADVTVLRRPDPLDRAALTGAVDALHPRGYTPIGRALRDAAAALPGSGPRSIVLVSDGADTCAPPDPCDVAKELSAGGVGLVVHAVGFGVDDPARNQLTCIAQRTGGTYTDAPDAKSLERVLPRVTQSALRNYQPAGIPITGAPDTAGAPQVRPGQYLDVLGRDKRKYYSLDVPAGLTVYLAATMPFAPTGVRNIDSVTLKISMFAADGTDCQATGSEFSVLPGSDRVITATLIWRPSPGAQCAEPGRYAFAVRRDGGYDQPEQLPIELLVGMEPAVTGDKGQPASTEPVDFQSPGAGGRPRPVTGGGSFNTAATLDGPGSYVDHLRFGERVYYRVYVDWGQGLAYRVRWDKATSFEGIVVGVGTDLSSPFRAAIDSAGTAYTNSGAVEVPHDGKAFATPVIRYLNRDAGKQNVSIAGWYYIAVDIEPDESTGTVPVTIELSVTGTPERGPAYDFTSDEARTAGVFGQGKPPAAGGGDPTPAPGEVNRAAGSAGFPTWWVVGGAAGVLVLTLVTVGFVTARRRRARRPV